MEGAASHPETPSMVLRDVTMSDLPIFFDQQLDPEGNWMAAFIAKDPADRDAFMARWTRILRDETITIQTILFDGQVAGWVLSYGDEDGQPQVSYWIGKPYWGKGIATRALSAFLDHIKERPLYARAAKDHVGSLRVLEKCGFTRIGQDKGFSNARGEEVEEYILRFDYDSREHHVMWLQRMQYTLAQEWKASSPIPLPFDEFQLGHMAFHHAIIDRPGETSSHRVFVFLYPGSKGLELCNSALSSLSKPGI